MRSAETRKPVIWQDALEASVPSTSRRQNSYDDITSPSSQTGLVRELRRMLEDLDDLIAARRRTLDDAKRAAEDDDIRPLVMEEQHAFSSKSSEKIEAAHFEDLFQKQLSNYNFYRDTLAGNERRQTDLLHRIAVRRQDSVLIRCFRLTKWICTTGNERALRLCSKE